MKYLFLEIISCACFCLSLGVEVGWSRGRKGGVESLGRCVGVGKGTSQDGEGAMERGTSECLFEQGKARLAVQSEWTYVLLHLRYVEGTILACPLKLVRSYRGECSAGLRLVPCTTREL